MQKYYFGFLKPSERIRVVLSWAIVTGRLCHLTGPPFWCQQRYTHSSMCGIWIKLWTEVCICIHWLLRGRRWESSVLWYMFLSVREKILTPVTFSVWDHCTLKHKSIRCADFFLVTWMVILSADADVRLEFYESRAAVWKCFRRRWADTVLMGWFSFTMSDTFSCLTK